MANRDTEVPKGPEVSTEPDFKLVKRAVPTLVVKNPTQILPYIFRAMKSKRMPSSGIKLFYLGAHPDLHVPEIPVKDLKVDTDDGLKMLKRSDWILSLVNEGILDFVLWQHPKWSGQVLDRQPTEYVIGEDSTTGRLSVNIPEAYFFKDGVFCLEQNMVYPKKFEFMVCPIHETHTMCRVCENIIQKAINKPFILVINLSSSSTLNPHAKRFTEDQFQTLANLFVPLPPITISIPPEELTSATVIEERGMLAADVMNAARRRQLNRMRYWLNRMENERPITSPEVLALWPREIFDLCELVLSVRSTQPDSVRITPAAVQAIVDTSALAKAQLEKYGDDLPPVALASGEEKVLEELAKLKLEPNDRKALFPSINDIENPGSLDSLFKIWMDVVEDPEMPEFKDEENEMVEVPKTEEELKDDDYMKQYPPFIRFWYPEYVSTKEEQEQLCDDQETLMNRFHNPYLIFVIRDDDDDGFTPKEQVHDIFIDQILGLERIYGPRILAVAFDYPDSEKDAEELKAMRVNVETLEESLERIDKPWFPIWPNPRREDNPVIEEKTSSSP